MMANMTAESTMASRAAAGDARSTHILMCPPKQYEVSYIINPWMNPEIPTSTDLALQQWQALHDLYVDLGMTVDLIEPIPGLPDMVFAANGGFTMDGIAYGAKFRYPERQPEGPAYLDRLAELGFEPREAKCVNEGEGDFLPVGEVILAGHGFRTDVAAHDELREIFGREVVSLRLVDPRFYHLDTCLAIVGETIAWLPEAFDEASRTTLERRFPDAIVVTENEALGLGLNAFGDGRAMVVPEPAKQFAADLAALGHKVRTVDLSELLKAGGSAKCCTLELRR